VFEGPDGAARLIDLFEGRRQFDRSITSCGCTTSTRAARVARSPWTTCPTRSISTKAPTPPWRWLSRAPYPRLSPFKSRMGWQLPFYSSHGNDFNYDFHVSNDESVAPIEYNYKDKATLLRDGLEYVAADGNRRGRAISVFVQDQGRVFHTYSAYGVGAGRDAQHLPVPRPDPARPAALHQRMALARHVRGIGRSCAPPLTPTRTSGAWPSRFRRELIAYGYRMLGSIDDAEEIVQGRVSGGMASVRRFFEGTRLTAHVACIASRPVRSSRVSSDVSVAPLPFGSQRADRGSHRSASGRGRRDLAWLQPVPDSVLTGNRGGSGPR